MAVSVRNGAGNIKFIGVTVRRVRGVRGRVRGDYISPLGRRPLNRNGDHSPRGPGLGLFPPIVIERYPCDHPLRQAGVWWKDEQ